MFEEFFVVLIRVIIIFPLFLVITLFMGKRSLGEVPIFDFLIIVTLASVTGADIADPNISQVHTVFAITVIALMQKITAYLLIKKRPFGKLITFEPTVVIKNGKVLVKNLTSIRYSIDNLLQLLREKDVFDINDVEIAIIEANGQLSVHKKSEKQEPTREDFNLKKKSPGMSYPVIIDGRFQLEVMNELGITEESLKKRLELEGVIRIERIFLATMNANNELQLAYTNKDDRRQLIQH
ncbi:DUF421 domain-containing protein [Halalkalibacterium ligniniphilum]|uniref:DUF421 domain-containing protein n=1 Tax=Halalkalibacterium ligniniphilum TaxID=1134413 RepID=UPI0003451915|nr:DUF421 domain-containing protein [Halalkalibacterium ligniniphilum]